MMLIVTITVIDIYIFFDFIYFSILYFKKHQSNHILHWSNLILDRYHDTWNYPDYSSNVPVQSCGNNHENNPPTAIHPLVTSNKAVTFPSNEPFTNCAAIAPRRPHAANNPIAEVLAPVGKYSTDMQSNEFHPTTENALNSDADITTTDACDGSIIKPNKLSADKHMP